MSIVCEGLTKNFNGSLAVDGLDLQIHEGEVYGLLGPNGAGKTTSLRMLTGLMVPTAGRATICGYDVFESSHQARVCLAFVTSSTGLYERLSAREMLLFCGRLYGQSSSEVAHRVRELAQYFDFEALLDRRCGTLSSGEKQRISLARALIHDPPVLILDEPTAGLDVLASRFVADVVGDAKARGRAILFSTHYMAEAELLCDRVGLLHKGRLLREDSPSQLREEMKARSLEEAFLRLIEEQERSS